MSNRNQQFQTIRTEGAILPPDVLRRIASLKTDGTSPDAYHLPPGNKLNEAISRSWTTLLNHWQAFQEVRTKLPVSDDTATTITNERWLLPLFKELEYGRLITTKSPEIDERVYPIERFYNHTPIHLIGCKLPLDRRTRGARGAATSSPHSMVQEFLNRSDEHIWAFLTNGLQLRILRDNVSLSRQSFVEFDLEAIMEGEVYADFALMWLLCHQSRVENEKPEDCWLENWSQIARDEGTRVLKDLRLGVAKAIEALGRGFIGHPRNDRLREKLHAGALGKDEYYRQLLRIVYRLLFLFVAEDRELLHPPDSSEAARDLYDTHYSTRRLRELALKIRGSKHADLWHSLSLVFDALGKNDGCRELGLCGLGSFLWRTNSTSDLLGPRRIIDGGESEPVFITNDDLLQAIRGLAYVEHDRVLRMVDYRNLGSEELGSVYEALLELHPIMNIEAKSFELLTAVGNERKLTGSYYTPDSLVQCLLDSALDPVVVDRLNRKKGQDAEKAILDIKVCDPACGSGHFLIAAAHRLARHLARIRTGESEPSPDEYQHALRDVIGRCVYGVDLNPMAVELCKVSLWMEAIEPGKPLSFLDHHIQCGNSLLGTTPALLVGGIPDEAFEPIEGDHKAVCNELKRDNKRQRQEYKSGQGYLFAPNFKLGNLPATISQINVASDDSLEHIVAKQQMYERMVKESDYINARLLADTWCAAFVWKKDKTDLGQLCPTERYFRNIENNPHNVLPVMKSEVRRLADQYQFFHWHLAFPDVFQLATTREPPDDAMTSFGFDVVLGNPPWEKLRLNEREWFASRDVEIAASRRASDRENLINGLAESNPSLFQQYEENIRFSLSTIHFLAESQRFPLCGRGDINTYSVFVECGDKITASCGRLGIISPTGILTDDTTKYFTQDILKRMALVSAYDFINSLPLFPDVKKNVKFCLLTLSHREVEQFRFAAQLVNVSDLQEEPRVIKMAASDLININPNTLNLPIFSSRTDAILIAAIYRRVPVLVREDDRPGNPWDICFNRMFHMTDDAGLFKTREELEADGFTLVRNHYLKGNDDYCPLYESKLVHQFNHRAATFDGIPVKDRFKIHAGTNGLTVNGSDAESPFTIPRFWVNSQHVEEKTASYRNYWNRLYFIGLRNAISATLDSRSTVVTVIPWAGIGNSLPLMFPNVGGRSVACLLGNLNSCVLDYVTRQKASGGNLNLYILKQLATLPPTAYESPLSLGVRSNEFFSRRVLELTYTAWDLEAFAVDCGYSGPPFRWDDERRFLLRCELDAAYFQLYLGTPSEWGTDSLHLREMFPTPHDAVDYIMDTFPIVRRKDIARSEIKNESGEVTQPGRYITKDTILEIYDEMQRAIESGEPYETRLNPPPGPPTDVDGNFIPMKEWDADNWPSHIHPPRNVETHHRKALGTER